MKRDDLPCASQSDRSKRVVISEDRVQLTARNGDRKVQVRERANSATKRLDASFRELKLKEKFFIEATEANAKKLDLLRLKIHNKRRDIKQYRGKMGGCLAYRENEKALAKTKKIIEDRIELTNVKLMEREDMNNRLKKAVDELRREVLVAKAVDERLMTEQDQHERNIYDLDNRFDAFEDELEDLDEQGRKMRESMEKQRRSLRNRYLFVEKQCNMDSVESKQKPAKPKPKRKPIAVDTGRLPSMVSATTQTKWKVAFNSVLKLNSEKTIKDYKDAFEKIKITSGVRDLTEFVARFKNIEQDNYKKFALVSDLQSQHETLTQELAEEKEALSKLNRKAATVDNQRKTILSGVQEQLTTLNSKTIAAQEKTELLNEELKDLQSGIKRILALLLPSEAPPARSSSTSSISSALTQPLMTYLGMIEQKVVQLAVEASRAKCNKAKDVKGCGVPQLPPSGSCTYIVHPPELRLDLTNLGTEYDTGPEHPLSYKELKEMVSHDLT